MLGRSIVGAGGGTASGTTFAGSTGATASGSSPVSAPWINAANEGSVPSNSAGRLSRARRCSSSSPNNLAAPLIEALTVSFATSFARWMVMPTARPTTIRIRIAVSPKSLTTSGNRARSTVYAFFGSSTSETVPWSSVCAVTLIILRRLVRLSELVLVLDRAGVAAVDGQQRRAGHFAVGRDFDVGGSAAALLVPGGDAVLAGRDVEGVVAVRVGEAVVRRRHHVHDRGHVRVHVA